MVFLRRLAWARRRWGCRARARLGRRGGYSFYPDRYAKESVLATVVLCGVCVGKRTILETLWFHSPIDSGDEIPGEITDVPHEGVPAFMLLIHEIPPHAKDSR